MEKMRFELELETHLRVFFDTCVCNVYIYNLNGSLNQ